MILAVDTEAKTSQLSDADNCDSITIVVTGSQHPADIDEVLMGTGRLAGDAAWINIDSIRGMAEGQAGDGWPTRFQMLLDKAGRSGGLNDDRTYISVPVTAA